MLKGMNSVVGGETKEHTEDVSATTVNGDKERDIVLLTQKKARKIRDEFTSASKILSFMYLSGRKAITEDDGKWLDKAKITHVVSLTQLIPPQMKDRKHVRHLKVRINDSENAKLELARKLPEILSFIEKARREGGKVLVHCDAGMSRSASVVLAYCMRFGKMTLIQATKLVRKRRTMISPNPAFMALLCDLERSLFGTVTLDINFYRSKRLSSDTVYMVEKPAKAKNY